MYILNILLRANPLIFIDNNLDLFYIPHSFSFRAQSAFGVLNAEDPFLKLKREISWDVVTNQCITLILLKKVPIIEFIISINYFIYYFFLRPIL